MTDGTTPGALARAEAARLRVGLAISLTGPLAPMGRDAHRALLLWAENARPAGRAVELVVRDDCGDGRTARRAAEALIAHEHVDVLLGPYSSGLTRAVARVTEANRMVLWNHGGSADDIHRRGYRMVVGIPTPASGYMAPALRWAPEGAVVVVDRRRSGFSAAVAHGAAVEASRQGRRVQRESYPARREGLAALVEHIAAEPPGLVVAAGRLADDIALARALAQRGVTVPTAFVAAGVRTFGEVLGPAAEGFAGPSQWEEAARVVPDLGPTSEDFARRFRSRFGVAPDYPAAQAYAAALVMARCLELTGGTDQGALRAAAVTLDVTTLFGRFSVDPASGIQVGHQVLLVQWVGGARRILDVGVLAPHPRAR